ncbi:MAG: hypothetical protein Q9170_006637, partial [Blastenia crenularia]
MYLFRYSERLGATAGPLLTSLVTAFPIISVSTLAASKGCTDEIEPLINGGRAQGSSVTRGFLSHAFCATISMMAFLTDRRAGGLVREWLQAHVLRSKVGLYHLLTLLYALLFPSGYLAFVVIPLIQATLFSAYIPLPYTNNVLNTTLYEHGFTLLARQDSNTGYISVLDNFRDGFRAMRCDHSLLGGEWIPPQGQTSSLHEPIYAIFVMLEAVRLVQPPSEADPAQGVQESALVIGLGIGTTPSAFVAHGINTTIVEIDPVVHTFAVLYFNLPTNHTSIIEDAVAYVDRSRGKSQYNYIIHDVFTGGAEPINLFTMEFLEGLKDMLKQEGVIAINYAGDLRLRSASMVVRTVLTVFPSCRLFREGAEPPEEADTDFTNLVLFCRAAVGAIDFRRPTKDDFLGSGARQHHLMPRHEVDATYFTRRYGEDTITKRNRHVLEKAQYASALGHWRVMR